MQRADGQETPTSNTGSFVWWSWLEEGPDLLFGVIAGSE